MKVIIKLPDNQVEIADFDELGRATTRLDRAGVDYDLDFVKA